MKAIRLNGSTIVFKLSHEKKGLVVEILGTSTKESAKQIEKYVRQWLDLDTDLKPFYRLARKDEILKPLVKSYFGYRIIGQPDLFESLVWAVLGQQINLAFAYTLKGRFVTSFGERVNVDGVDHHLFPEPATVQALHPDQLLALQFSRQKAAYTINIAKAFHAGELSTELLRPIPFEAAKERLRQIKGVGNWTANYALMRTFQYPDAFPLEDAGLHNAIKNQLGLKSKPSLDKVKRLFKKYKGWEAYATLYLWKSL